MPFLTAVLALYLASGSLTLKGCGCRRKGGAGSDGAAAGHRAQDLDGAGVGRHAASAGLHVAVPTTRPLPPRRGFHDHVQVGYRLLDSMQCSISKRACSDDLRLASE